MLLGTQFPHYIVSFSFYFIHIYFILEAAETATDHMFLFSVNVFIPVTRCNRMPVIRTVFITLIVDIVRYTLRFLRTGYAANNRRSNFYKRNRISNSINPDVYIQFLSREEVSVLIKNRSKSFF